MQPLFWSDDLWGSVVSCDAPWMEDALCITGVGLFDAFFVLEGLFEDLPWTWEQSTLHGGSGGDFGHVSRITKMDNLRWKKV